MMPCKKLVVLWGKIQGALEAMGVTGVDARELIRGGDAVEFALVHEVMAIYCELNLVLAALSYLREKLYRPESLTKFGVIEMGVKRAVAVCDVSVTCALALLATESFNARLDAADLELVVARSMAAAWCSSVPHLLQCIKVAVVMAGLSTVDVLVCRVRSHTPDFEHVVNDETYSKVLAQQVLVDHPHVQLLEAETGDLYSAIVDLAQTIASWQVKSQLDADEVFTSGKSTRQTYTTRPSSSYAPVRGAILSRTPKGKTRSPRPRPF